MIYKKGPLCGPSYHTNKGANQCRWAHSALGADGRSHRLVMWKVNTDRHVTSKIPRVRRRKSRMRKGNSKSARNCKSPIALELSGVWVSLYVHSSNPPLGGMK
jgi:hypothetical protein